jgi:hypothetical protein
MSTSVKMKSMASTSWLTGEFTAVYRGDPCWLTGEFTAVCRGDPCWLTGEFTAVYRGDPCWLTGEFTAVYRGDPCSLPPGGKKNSVLSSKPFSGVWLVTVISTYEIGEGLPAWRGTVITAKVGLHVKLSPGFLDYARVLASESKQQHWKWESSNAMFIQNYCMVLRHGQLVRN